MKPTANLAGYVALGLAALIVAISLFLVLVGYPMSGGSETMTCSTGNSCTSIEQFTNTYVPTYLGAIPLILGLVTGIGLYANRLILSWSGSIVLLVFSFIGIFSIGFYFLPLAIALIAFMGLIQGRKSANFQRMT